MDLNFLHPIQEIVITIRKLAEMGSSTSNSTALGYNGRHSGASSDSVMKVQTGGIKNYLIAYHGGGKDPNYRRSLRFHYPTANTSRDAREQWRGRRSRIRRPALVALAGLFGQSS